ncbi:hypothetical protein RSWS8N_16014 [Cereibacter sphaeroides WS8N]|uniref:3-keto-5-aminohexanoate cleavage protein n=1 Tax=Cereibacter sphaeroides TaxID=1063 RepID=UPI00020B00E7|nr:3-keto-5-aminohexanoate cleavage protein [Cereibacter sphaeroides]EGJ19681.1 hypothetical protein RSWS8N_16014 [Cereibacter sphaeroides WS8N]
MAVLPRIMLAPNGARLTKADHPALPVTIPEIVAAARAGRAAGADGLHAHVRDAEGRHVLDAGLYAELLAELDRAAPGFPVQVTTEAVGRYTPAEQRALVERLRPASVSIAFREISAEPDPRLTRRFFAFCAEAGCHVQHILYDLTDVAGLAAAVADGTVPEARLAVLIVLGRYTAGQRSAPEDLEAPVQRLRDLLPEADWAICAFGPRETECLVAASRKGGKMRIGFENNLLQADGTPAADNAARVAELVAALEAAGQGTDAPV